MNVTGLPSYLLEQFIHKPKRNKKASSAMDSLYEKSMSAGPLSGLLEGAGWDQAEALRESGNPVDGLKLLLGETSPETQMNRKTGAANLEGKEISNEMESWKSQILGKMQAAAESGDGESLGLMRMLLGNGAVQPGEKVQSSVRGKDGNQHVIMSDGTVKNTGLSFDPNTDVFGGALINKSTGEEILSAEQGGTGEGVSEVHRGEVVRQNDAYNAMLDGAAERDSAVSVIDEAMAHPGFNAAYGVDTVLPATWTNIPGTDKADFLPFLEQAQGKVFLEAFQRLKGGGQITEVESAKAEQAMARIGNQGQSDASAKQAWQDLKSAIIDGERKLREASRGRLGGVSVNAEPERTFRVVR